MLFVDVILPLPLEGMFTYSVPQNLSGAIGERKRVLVPVGPSKTYVGIIGRIHQDKPEFKCRDILNVIDEQPIILPEQQRLWQWIADYYLSPIGEVFNAAMPGRLKAEEGFRPRTETYVTLAEEYRNEESLNTLLDNMQRARAQKQLLLSYLSLSHYDSLNGSEPEIPIAEVSRDELVNSTTVSLNTFSELKKRGILVAYQREVGRLNLDSEENPEAIKQLNDVQTKAYDEIITSFRSHDVTLLHGVTSSGKTEIYIHLIWKAINEGKQLLYLLPEIALTVQIMARLRKVFGSRLGIYHSKYSDEERAEIWQKQMSDKPFDVILGARSAVFLPQKKTRTDNHR